MSLNEFLNDKKYTAAFFLLALCFFLLDWYLFAAVGGKGRTHPPAGDRNRSSGKPGQTSEKKQPDALSGNSSRRYCGRYGFLRLYGKRLHCGRNKGRRK